MADSKDCLPMCVLTRAKEAHAKDTADEGGGQKKHRQDLDVSQCSAVLMGSTCDLCGFASHFKIDLRDSISDPEPGTMWDRCSRTSASR